MTEAGSISTWQAKYETLTGEGLKTAAEVSLQLLGRSALGQAALERYAFQPGNRLRSPQLETVVAGIPFENPVLVGAGWDKKGRAIHGLYHLGFGGVEVGTVLAARQYGEAKPRLWMIDEHHSVGLNRMSFNSPGMEPVAEYLEASLPFPCPIGLNVGQNKDVPNYQAAEAHAAVIRRLGMYASYIALGISSPNTPGLRGLQDKEPLRELIQAAQVAMPATKPLFIKIDSERSEAELHDMIEVVLEEGGAGFIATNTYMGSDLKAKYGKRWAHEAGGLSGNDPGFRRRATATIRRLYEEAGDQLEIIGVGGVDDATNALEKIQAGASAVQVVTAIRSTWGRVAADINRGLVLRMALDRVTSVQDYIGVTTKRGPKY